MAAKRKGHKPKRRAARKTNRRRPALRLLDPILNSSIRSHDSAMGKFSGKFGGLP